MAHKVKPNRLKRREKREAVLGPERLVVKVLGGSVDLLECGHQLYAVPGGLTRPGIGGVVRRRCSYCLIPARS